MSNVFYFDKEGMDKFYGYVMEHLFDDNPDMAGRVEMDVKDVKKNNGTILKGLTIRKEGQSIAPTLYLEDYFKDHVLGKSLEECLNDIRDLYYEQSEEFEVDMSFFDHFEEVKPHVKARLINTDLNQHMIDEIPHFEYGDMSIAYFVDVDIPDVEYDGSIRILNEHLEMWGITPQELHEVAMENLENTKFNVFTMADMLTSLRGEDDLGLHQLLAESRMFVVTSEHKLHGAIAMLRADLLEEHADRVDSSFYVLPSSIHELIFVHGHGLPDDVREMVCEINDEQLELSEVLAYNAYYYDKDEKQLYRLDTKEPMHIVNNMPYYRIVVDSKDLGIPKKESIKEKMDGYKAVVKNMEPAKKNTPDKKKDTVRE